jgi:lambda repressor-like predicted transcriptional regulator
MSISNLHPQDVLAAIRKVYGSAAAFERAHSLPLKSVHEVVVRKRPSARVSRAIEKLLSRQAELSANSRAQPATHPQNSEAA